MVRSPNKGTGDNDLRGISAISSTDIWAVGFALDDVGLGQALILHWDGSGWRTVPSPHPFEQTRLFAVTAVGPDDVWAVGDYYDDPNGGTLTEHWDGARWSLVPSRTDGILEGAAAMAADDVWAVGYRLKNGYDRPLTLHWTGERWHVVVAPTSQVFGLLRAVAGAAPDDVWTTGNPGLADHWDGAAWHLVAGTTASDDLLGTTAITPADVWAVGRHDDRSLIRHWDRTTWRSARSWNPGQSYDELDGVAAAAPDDVWAVGTYGDSNREQLALIQHWDGTSWQLVPGAVGKGHERLRAVAAAGGEVWAVGQHLVGGVWKTLVEENCQARA